MDTPRPTQPNWCVYLILCRNGSLYCGISNRPAARFTAHLQGKGAKYTRTSPPLAMRIVSDGLDKSTALKREAEIKKLPTIKKRDLWAAAEATEVTAV
ncbi:GIY-YIG nuclease family protein [Bergeriella denitrificans]|uniref:Putative endonuclease n=1 Tax=Bergeriella denitrificans TaxID=494 RepID=A0A378UI47_BERDE|nr:GIY-YIG nuclease family protein [Bergeriella denitrificans]STZ76975.1 putative endonuclease [Bergeriella denitrificans]